MVTRKNLPNRIVKTEKMHDEFPIHKVKLSKFYLWLILTGMRDTLAYHLSLKAFEGPLDLLLHLVSVAQIDIREIFLSEITDEFLAYISYSEDLDMVNASEFIAMAARLMEIKSRRLLPASSEDEELERAQEELILQLDEYARMKQAAGFLKDQRDFAQERYYRLPQEVPNGVLELPPSSIAIEQLTQAFLRLMSRSHDPEDERLLAREEIEQDHYTLQQRMFSIRSRLSIHPKISFFEFFGPGSSREEMVVTFLALLELVKMSHVVVEQADLYGDILISLKVSEKKEASYGV